MNIGSTEPWNLQSKLGNQQTKLMPRKNGSTGFAPSCHDMSNKNFGIMDVKDG
jgi:hypothetical protein